MSQFRPFSPSESEKLKWEVLLSVLWCRLDDFYIVRGKDRGSEAQHQILVDCKKRQQFRKRLVERDETDTVELREFGELLDSQLGHDAPPSGDNRGNQFTDLIKKLVLVKLQKEGYNQMYYIVADVEREHRFITASSEEEIGRIGKILHSTRDEEPAETLCAIFEKEFFGLEEYHSTGDNGIFDFVRNGELQRVATYLEEGGDIDFADKYRRSLLHHAAHSGNMEMIRFLKVKGANVHSGDKMCGRKPVHISAKEGHLSAISFFLLEVDSQLSPNNRDQINWTPLHYAVWKGDLNCIKFLVENGAEINSEEACAGKKPIHIAAEHGYKDVIKYLIENGANIEERDSRCRTPLYHSVLEGCFEISKFLLDKGADISTKNNENRSLLHAAVFADDKEIIEFLVKAGVDIDGKEKHGLTPLHIAAQNHLLLNMVQILADLGANLFAVDNKGQNPLQYSGKKHADLVLHLAYRMCKKLQEEGKYSDALQLYNENIDIIKQLRQDHPEYLEIRNKFGIMLYEMGQNDKAEATFKDVLEYRERCLGTYHYDTLCTKHGLALVYDAQIRYSEAMQVLKDVLEARKSLLGEDHNDTLDVSRDLANVHKKKGEYDEALEIFKNVFAKRNRHFGSDHIKTLQAKQDIAVILVNKGDFEKALQIFKDVLEKRKVLLDNNHPDIVSTVYHVELTSAKIKEKKSGDQGWRCSIS